MRSRTHRIASDGLELVADVMGEGPPLLFAHALGSCRHQARLRLEPLAARRRLILVDQRGHCGSSPVTDPTRYDPERMAGDLGAVLDALDVPRAAIVGESMGAATALLFALAHPERVTHLIQIAPTVVDRPNPGQELVAALADLAERHGIEATRDAATLAAMAHGLPREVGRLVTASWGDHQIGSFIAAHRAVAGWHILASLEPVARLEVPIGIIAWGQDPTRPIAQARRLATAAANCRLEALDSLAVLVADPGLYPRLIERLLGE
jgi:pimeloyl-ACP methyl ester carboxylesterase